MTIWHRPKRAVPKTAKGKLGFLLGRSKNPDTAGTAGKLGVTERTLKAWLTGKRNPSKANAAKLDEAATDKWEDKARELAKEAGEPYVRGGGSGGGAGGGGGEAPAGPPLRTLRFNGQCTLFGGSGHNYDRPRSITQNLTADQGARAAQAYASGDLEGLHQVAAEALADYFNTGGYRNFTPDSLGFDVSGCDFE